LREISSMAESVRLESPSRRMMTPLSGGREMTACGPEGEVLACPLFRRFGSSGRKADIAETT
jgi:hypothetical protein